MSTSGGKGGAGGLAAFKRALGPALARWRAAQDGAGDEGAAWTAIWTDLKKVPLRTAETAWRELSPYQRAVGWLESNALDDEGVTYEDALFEALFWAVATKATRAPSADFMRRAQAEPEGWTRTASLMPTTAKYQADVAAELRELKAKSGAAARRPAGRGRRGR